MPAVSKKQQRFFGMVRAAQKTGKASSLEVAKVAATIKRKDAKDIASTKHKGLPMKKEETVGNVLIANDMDEIKELELLIKHWEKTKPLASSTTQGLGLSNKSQLNV